MLIGHCTASIIDHIHVFQYDNYIFTLKFWYSLKEPPHIAILINSNLGKNDTACVDQLERRLPLDGTNSQGWSSRIASSQVYKYEMYKD